MKHHFWGPRSIEHLSTVDPDLYDLCSAALHVSPFDLTVTCGLRGEADQEQAVAEGRSKVHWPHGKHNAPPGQRARAVDIHPHPIDWQDVRRYYMLAGIMLTLADHMGIRVRWGGDWDGDGQLTDQTFNDLPHFELRDR